MNKHAFTPHILVLAFVMFGLGLILFSSQQQGLLAITGLPVATPTSCGDVNESLTLTSDISVPSGSTCLFMNVSDVTLDCAGYKLYGDDSAGSIGILVDYEKKNITITNCRITDVENGIYLNKSGNVSVLSSQIWSNTNGISFYVDTRDTKVNNSNFTENYYHTRFLGYATDSNLNTVLYNNTFFASSYAYGNMALDGACNIYMKDNYVDTTTGGMVSSTFGCVSHSYFEGNYFRISGYLAIAEGGGNITAKNNYFNNTAAGIIFRPYYGAYYLINNTFVGVGGGAAFGVDRGATNSVIENNTFDRFSIPVSVGSSSDGMRIVNNRFSNGETAIYLGGSSHNLIKDNTFTNFSTYGVNLAIDTYFGLHSQNNTIENNNITNVETTVYSTIPNASYVNNTQLKITKKIGSTFIASIDFGVVNESVPVSKNITPAGKSMKLSERICAIDTAAYPEYNMPANISFKVLTCSPTPEIKYSSDFVKLSNFSDLSPNCNETSTPSCTNIVCADNILNFTVEGFSTYGVLPACASPISGETIASDTDLCSGNFPMTSGLIVGEDDVRISCNNTVMSGPYAMDYTIGIDFQGRNNVTLDSCTINNFWHGLYFYGSTNNTITNNLINHSFWDTATFNYYSTYNLIKNNTFSNAGYGGGPGGHEFIVNNCYNQFIGNTYLNNINAFGYQGGICRLYFTNNTFINSGGINGWVDTLFDGNRFVGNSRIAIEYTFDGTFKNNVLINNSFFTVSYWNNSLINNEFINTPVQLGMSMYTYGNILINNTFSGTGTGLYFGEYGNNSLIENNTFSGFDTAILFNSSKSIVTGNNMFNNYLDFNSTVEEDNYFINQSFRVSNPNGVVSWPDTTFNFTRTTYDNIIFGSDFVAVNSSLLTGLNSSANVSIATQSYTNTIYKNDLFTTTKSAFLSGAYVCPDCTNVLFVDGKLNFTVSSFSGYGTGIEINSIYPNGSGVAQNVSAGETNISLNRPGSTSVNLTFNATTNATGGSVTFSWFIDGVVKFIETLLSGITSVFSHLFASPGQTNVTVYVNVSDNNAINDTFTFDVNITNQPPQVANLSINSTYELNSTKENLTAYWTSTDPNNDPITNITDWRINGNSFAVLNMPFERGSSNSTFTKDYTTYGNNGTVMGASWMPYDGYDGNGAYNLTEIGQFISTNVTSASVGLNGSNPITFSAWLKPNTTGAVSGDNAFFSILPLVDIPDGNRGLFFALGHTGYYRIARWSNDLDTSTKFDTNQWQYITITYSPDVYSIYKNGVLDSTLPGLGKNVNETYVLNIGRSGHYFPGLIDKVLVFNRALSEEQIFALYQNQSNFISENETKPGENWSVAVTPNDGYQDGETVLSNQITISQFNITAFYPNATNDTEIIDSGIRNTSISIPGRNQTFNITVENTGQSLTFSWFVNGLQKFVETLTGIFSSIFSFLFFETGQYNITVVVNDSAANDTFTWFVDVPCVEPYAGMQINKSTLLCSGTYDVFTKIDLINNDVIVLCNQTILNGDYSNDMFDIGYHNGTRIQNCEIQYASNAIIFQNNNTDITIFNNSIHDSNNAMFVSGERHLIKNNNLYGFGSSTIYGVSGTRFSTIVGNNIHDTNDGIRLEYNPSNNNIISNNTISNTWSNRAISLCGGGSNTIENNNLSSVTGGIYDYCVSPYSFSSNDVIRNNKINSCDNSAIEIASGLNVTIENNVFYSISSYSIRANDNLSYSSIVGNNMSNIGNGIYIGSTAHGANIRNNLIFNSGGEGIITFGSGDNITIANNNISSTSSNGINLGGSGKHSTISNNSIVSTNQAIYLWDGEEGEIENNFIETAYQGIYLSSTAAKSRIINNTILSISDIAITSYFADNSTISNNYINAVSSDGVYVNNLYENLVAINNTILNTSGSNGAFYVYLSSGLGNITFIDNTINISSNYGLHLDNNAGIAVNSVIERNNIYSVPNGLYLDTYMSNSVLNFNYIEAASNYAIYVYDGTNLTTSNNFINSTGGSGVYVQNGYGNTIATNNTILNTNSYALFLYDATNSTISNNHIDVALDGIYVSNAIENLVVTNNTILNSSGSNGAFAIYMSSGPGNLSFVNNLVNKSANYGLYLNGLSAYNTTIERNRIYSVPTGIYMGTWMDGSQINSNYVENTNMAIQYPGTGSTNMSFVNNYVLNTTYQAIGPCGSGFNELTVVNNTIIGAGTGINFGCGGNNNVSFENNTLINISSIGIVVAGKNNINDRHTFFNNFVSCMNLGSEIGYIMSDGSEIRNANILENTAKSCSVGFELRNGGVRDSIFSKNNITDSISVGVYLTTGANQNITFINNIFDGNAVGINQSTTTGINYFVKTNGINTLTFPSTFFELYDDDNFFINDSIVAVNSISESTMANKAANVSFTVNDCSRGLFKSPDYYTSFIPARENSSTCVTCSVTACSGTTMNFTTSSFSTIVADYVAPNITAFYPNATNATETIGDSIKNTSIVIPGRNQTFNISVQDTGQSLTFTWFVNGVVKLTQTLLGAPSGIFNFIFTQSGQYNVTATINDSTITDSFSWFVNVTCIEPQDDMYVAVNTLFCPGTYNLPNGIKINASNIIIQCNDTLFNGTSSGDGMQGFGRNNVTIISCNLSNYQNGIYIQGNATRLENNTLSSMSNMGLQLNYANQFISGNKIYETDSVGIYIANGCVNSTIINNVLVGTTTRGIFANSGCHNTIISGNQISNTNGNGIFSLFSRDLSVSNNILINSSNECLFFVGAINNTVINNTITDTAASAIFFTNTPSENNTIIGNVINKTTLFGINLDSTKHNLVSNNLINNPASYSVLLSGSNYNEINNNTFVNSTRGIYLSSSSNNTILNNYFFNNTRNIFSEQSTSLNTLIVSVQNNSLVFHNKLLNVTSMNNIFINDSIVAVNSSAEPQMNTTANLSFTVNNCNAKLFSSPGFYTDIEAAKPTASECTTCTVNSCSGNTLNFTTSSFSTIFANVAPNITAIYPNATNETELIDDSIKNTSISIPGRNQTFNITVQDTGAPLTFTWFVNGVVKLIQTLTGAITNAFSFLFNIQGQYNVTVFVNDSLGNDTFIWFTNIVCIEPYSGMNITNSTLLCPGQYNLANGIIVNASSIVVQCNHTILNGTDGAGTRGILVSGFSNITVRDCEFDNFQLNMRFDSSSQNNTLINNTVFSGVHGISMDSSSNNIIFKNTVINSTQNILLNSVSDNNNVTSNTVFGTLGTNNIYATALSKNNIIYNNVVNNGNVGLFADSSSTGNKFFNNTVRTITVGINIGSNNNTFENNTISLATNTGVLFSSAAYNVFYNNNITNNLRGISVIYSENNTIMNNFICNNTNYGVRFASSGGNNVLQNNTLFNNTLIDITTEDDLNNTLIIESAQNNIMFTKKIINVTRMTNFFIGSRIGSLNSSAEPQMNVSAEITLAGLTDTSTPAIYRAEDFYTDADAAVAGGASCNPLICTDVSYSSGTLSFNVSHFSSYAVATPSTLPTCSDGIQNQGETGIDCGGPCSSCGGGGTSTPPVVPPVLPPVITPVVPPQQPSQPVVETPAPVLTSITPESVNTNPFACVEFTEKKIISNSSAQSIIDSEFNKKIPVGYDVLVPAFKVDCVDSKFKLTLSLPDSYANITALKCTNNKCSPVKIEEVKQVKCGENTYQEINRKTSFLEPEFFPIELNKVELQKGASELESERTKVKFVGNLQGKVTLDRLFGRAPEPTNSRIKIVSTPTVLTFEKVEQIGTNITLPYVLPEHVDELSVAMYAYKNNEWLYLGGAVDKKDKTVSTEIKDVSQYIEDEKLTLSLMGLVCLNCVESDLNKVYDGGSRDAIILVHGFENSPERFDDIINDVKLTQQPWQAWTFGYPSSISIEENGKDLADLLQVHTKEYDYIYFAAHSLGGLITQQALYYANEQNKGKINLPYTFLSKVVKVVSVATPNKGALNSQISNLFNFFVNHDAAAGLFNLNSGVLKELETGKQIPQVPGIEYLVVAGTMSYEFTSNLFKSNEINDGIVSLASAQTIGGQQVNDYCKNFWGINTTHNDLLNNFESRKIIERIVAKQVANSVENKAIIGYNQFFELSVNECTPGDQYVIVGVPVEKKAQPDPGLCACGNGVCGTDENEMTCPSDCARIEKPATSWLDVILGFKPLQNVLMMLGFLIIAVTVLVMRHKPAVALPQKTLTPSAEAEQEKKLSELLVQTRINIRTIELNKAAMIYRQFSDAYATSSPLVKEKFKTLAENLKKEVEEKLK